MNTVLTCHGVIVFDSKQKKMFILLLVIAVKSEKNKFQKSIQMQNKKRILFIRLIVSTCYCTTVFNSELKKASAMPFIIEAKSEKDKFEKLIKI